MMKIISQGSTALWLSLALLSTPISAKSLAHIEGVINQVQPQGTGRLNFWGFHVYDATLYRPAGKDSAEFALDIKYQKSFSGAAIASRTADEMKGIGVSEAQSAIWGKELAAVLPNIESGQTLTGVYSPKQGTTFFYDGKKIAQFPGADFSRAFFGIWLDSKTSVPKLRSELLGNGCPPPLITGAC
jgi:hypothetical protein